MKTRILLCALPILAAAASTHAALIYSGVQNIAIPIDPPLVGLEGVYLNLLTGATTTAYPGDWDTAPWINPAFGGSWVLNSALLRPVITGSDKVLNLALGTVIDDMGNFVPAASASTTHLGVLPGEFQVGTPGLIGVAFKTAVVGPDYYGWIRMTANNTLTQTGTIVDWAYDNVAGTAVQAGISAVPEPAEAARIALLALPAFCAMLRRRRSHAACQ
jgi:hypothetical protein